MSDLEILRKGFVAFLDGLWWGLRDNVGPLSMYEGYAEGFRRLGNEAAEKSGGKGPDSAANVATDVFRAIGLEIEQNGSEIIIKSCPIWDRILERGLEYSFHVEEICWKPMLDGIGEKMGVKSRLQSSLRLAHLSRVKIEYKKGKAKASLDTGTLEKSEFDLQMTALEQDMTEVPEFGRYHFK